MKGFVRRKTPHSVFHTIVVPLFALVVLEVFILVTVFFGNNVIDQLNANAEEIVQKQVNNRANVLINQMYNWSDLNRLANTINTATQSMLDSGEISLDTLDSNSEACAPLILEIAPELISTLYSKKVTGIYVIFNTQDINKIPAKRTIPNKTGIYIRDMDPSSTPSSRNEDLLLSRASIYVAHSMDLAVASCWKPKFVFSEVDQIDDYCYFTQPMREAFKAESIRSADDYGYWGCSVNTLTDSDITAMTYSIPLVLEDGTIYGVLGIDVLNSYLQTLLPTSELYDGDMGAYFLTIQRSSHDSLRIVTPFVWKGADFDTNKDVSLKLSKSGIGYTFNYGLNNSYFAAVKPINLYSSHAPFESERWTLIGAVPSSTIYSFSQKVLFMLVLDLVIMAIVGLIGSLVIGKRLSGPIHQLSTEVEKAQSGGYIPNLSRSGIIEIDKFADSFTTLSCDVISASTRFLRIIHMASIEIGGFEIQYDSDSVYVTDNLFQMFGIEGYDISKLTVEKFKEITDKLSENFMYTIDASGNSIYKLEQDGADRYIRVSASNYDNKRIGIVEDVTNSIIERIKAEHERDYDALTGLLARGAFFKHADSLFAAPDSMGYAALMMFDTDNLKMVNDRFGHDYGDAYLVTVSKGLVDCAPQDAICARVSGDEFYMLIYGYSDMETRRKAIKEFSDKLKTLTFPLPNGSTLPISISGGIALYPEHSTDFTQLKTYADFAMYEVKHSTKNNVKMFNLDVYNRESVAIKRKEDFVRLILEERILFHFQPIISAVTGKPVAYEALMRSEMPNLSSPGAILSVAEECKRLQDVEDLVWIKAPHFFRTLLEQKKVVPDAKLFINTIPSQTLSEKAQSRFLSENADIIPRIVTEITEQGRSHPDIIQIKRNAKGGSCVFAIDDYGSGYNSELTLLELAPNYIKIDISIINDIDTDTNKQKLVENIVQYAHERNQLIVAEGVETVDELKKVLELGVDLMQGYLLARPAAIPAEVPKRIVDIIVDFNKNKDKNMQL